MEERFRQYGECDKSYTAMLDLIRKRSYTLTKDNNVV